MSEAYPFIGGVQQLALDETLPTFKECAWDFSADNFIRKSDGTIAVVEKDEALKVWVYKALKTERFEYLAYSWQYGIELKPFIGLVMTVQERYSELKRIITECLMVNPYIKSIDSVTFETQGDYTHVNIILSTIYSEGVAISV